MTAEPGEPGVPGGAYPARAATAPNSRRSRSPVRPIAAAPPESDFQETGSQSNSMLYEPGAAHRALVMFQHPNDRFASVATPGGVGAIAGNPATPPELLQRRAAHEDLADVDGLFEGFPGLPAEPGPALPRPPLDTTPTQRDASDASHEGGGPGDVAVVEGQAGPASPSLRDFVEFRAVVASLSDLAQHMLNMQGELEALRIENARIHRRLLFLENEAFLNFTSRNRPAGDGGSGQ
eukprot:5856798-Alexandrium_andersonii.AAC.1